MQNDITTGLQTVTAAGVVTGTLDTSAMVKPFTLCLDVLGLTAGAAARIVIEDTASATPFNDALPVKVWDITGQVEATADVNLSIKSTELPTIRYGAAHNQLRANVVVLNGTSPSLSLHSFLQQ